MQHEAFIIFGEVLFDCFQNGQQILGGAPFNVAWHLNAFKQKPLLISRIGNDIAGQNILTALQNWGMNNGGVQIDSFYPTGKVSVNFINNEPDYFIEDNQAYDYIETEEFINLNAKILYHGSLALRHNHSRNALANLKSRHQGKIFLDVNLRYPWWHINTLSIWLAEANWVKLNEYELRQIQAGSYSLEDLMHNLMADYQLEGLIVTRGSEGALALDTMGQITRVTPYTNLNIVDTVGAGDAFSAVMLLGLHLNWPLFLSMQRAQDFACALICQPGATLQDASFYQPFVENWKLGN